MITYLHAIWGAGCCKSDPDKLATFPGGAGQVPVLLGQIGEHAHRLRTLPGKNECQLGHGSVPLQLPARRMTKRSRPRQHQVVRNLSGDGRLALQQGPEDLDAGGVGEQPEAFSGEVDRVYPQAPSPLLLDSGQGMLQIAAAGFPDVVVWNPGALKGPAFPDLEPQGYRRFVCVEAAAAASPIELEPGQEWSGSQILTTNFHE